MTIIVCSKTKTVFGPKGGQPGGFRLALLGACAGASLLVAAPVLAAPPAADSDTTTQIPEVIVTATRQDQALRKVSQSISAYTSKALDARGVKDVSDIARLTPGIQFDPVGFGPLTNIAIRGISSGTGAATTGIYIDDTPIQTRVVGYASTNAYPLVFDLDRVEVLRGPQGTLFGAGSEGGAVRFITPAPSLTTFSANGRAEVSGIDSGGTNDEIGLGLGGPIIQDKLGFRVSAWYRNDGGYIDRVNLDPASTSTARVKDSNSANTFVLHAALTIAPTDNLTITPSIFYQRRNQNDINTYWQGYSNPDKGEFINGQPLAQPDRDIFMLPALNIQYETHGVRIISNTSLFENRDQSVIDYSTYLPAVFGIPLFALGPDFTAAAQNDNRQRVLTEEVRIQSADAGARLNWVAGLFFSSSRQRSYETVVSPNFGDIPALLTGGFLNTEEFFGLPLVNGQDALVGTSQGVDSQIAGFGQIDYKITDKLKLTAGLRVAQTTFQGSSLFTGPFVGTTTVQNPGSTTEHPVTPKFGATYQFDDRNLVYFSAAEGYRVGGVNAPVGAICQAGLTADGFSEVPPTYASDSLWSYELGSKKRMFGDRLEVSASGYHVDWSNIQQLVQLPCGAAFDANLGVATSNGFDLQMAFRPLEGLSFDVATGYTDAQFSKTIAGALGNLIAAGDHLETHPWTLALGAAYERELADGYRGYIRADYQYKSSGALTAITDSSNTAYDPAISRTPQTSFLSLRSGVRVGGADVSVFVDNLTNTHPALVIADEVIGGPNLNDPLRAQTFQPRTVGVTVIFRQ